MQPKITKRLYTILPKQSGRDNQGHVAVRHQGGRHKRFYRIIDWKRDKENVKAHVVSIEYDPNRSAQIALLHYTDGDKRYIIAPLGLKIGTTIVSGKEASVQMGNCLKLRYIPAGTVVHNLEIRPGSGAQMMRSAGSAATVLSKDGSSVQLKLPSGEIRVFHENCRATVGQIGNADWKNRVIGKAGRNRNLGKRPTVRGVAQHPGSHPHGGGEGRSGIGMPSPKSPWGKPTLGKKTRKRKKYSNAIIVERGK
ncbi:50S ribosomal protein L2 [Patescibacteria group bacterium]|nr:50S ribosomal protein L2 [Patescibacteria group bacterium]MBU1472302.1 50S ribosomal protein L2 [Patescibacteria group bacterium]MBU2460447.1 50S ribosomal protein L2 [Patescibacteria group bacterium]MBU2543982.1 50S ribosomal protein L2 [Patescibacteria group bacterium]